MCAAAISSDSAACALLMMALNCRLLRMALCE